MKKQLLAMAMAGAMLLGGCQPTYNENDPNYPGTTQPVCAPSIVPASPAIVST